LNPAQPGQEFFGEPCAEILEILIGSEILEGQHRNRGRPPGNGWNDVASRCVRRVLIGERSGEILLHGATAPVPSAGVTFQRAFDHSRETCGHIGPAIGQRREAAIGVRGTHGFERVPYDRVLLREEVIEQHADAVDVTGDRGWLVVEEFGSQIERSSHQVRFRREPLRPDLARAQIHEYDAPAGVAHHVLCLDVAMEKAGFVHGGDGTAHINSDDGCLLSTEHTARTENLFECQAFYELHPQSDGPVMLINTVYGDHVGVPYSGKQAPFSNDGRRPVARPQDLQRNVALERRVPRQVDHGETATADLSTDLEPSPRARNGQALPGPGRGRHAVRRLPMSCSHACDHLQLTDDFLPGGVVRG
jgi:hypothetical protein